MLLLTDGQTGDDGERHEKAMLLRTSVVHWVYESCLKLIFRSLTKRIDFLNFLTLFNGIIVDTKQSVCRKISCTC